MKLSMPCHHTIGSLLSFAMIFKMNFFRFLQNPKSLDEISQLVKKKDYAALAIRLEKRMEFGTAGIYEYI